MSTLKFLHPESSLSTAKLAQYRKLTTEQLLSSLLPGETGALKTREDGTVMDGHHRLKMLQERGVNIQILPRETVSKDADVP